MDNEPEKEQAQKPSSKEEPKVDPSKEEQETKPSDSMGRYDQFLRKQTEKKAAAAKETPKEKKDEPPSEEKAAEKKVEDSKPKSRIYVLDEQGNKKPLVLNVDGKEIEVSDPEDLKTKGQIWYHHDTRGKELNDREAALKEKEKELEVGSKLLSQALEEIQLRSKSDTQKLSEKEQVEEEEDEDDELLDPELSKTRKELRESRREVKKLMDEFNMLKKAFILDKVEAERTNINKGFEALKGDKFKYADKEDVLRYMAEYDEKGNPKYSLEDAVKKSHEKFEGLFKQFLKENPEVAEITDAQKKQVIREYNESKAKEEEAPISSPSESTAGDTAPTPKKEKDIKKEGYGSPSGAFEAWKEIYNAKKREAAKF